jgi:hypothetical protein
MCVRKALIPTDLCSRDLAANTQFGMELSFG